MRQRGSYFFPMICALIEHPTEGLTLIDGGFGRSQLVRGELAPDRLVAPFARIKLEPSQTARAQIEDLGYRVEELRRIVMTHLHWDHADALADFPGVPVLVDARELRATERFFASGYSRFQLFDVNFQARSLEPREHLGFSSSLDLFGDSSLVLVDLPGHSAGHWGLSMPRLERPLFFCADAYFEDDELERSRVRPFQWLNTCSYRARWQTLQKLASLKRERPELELLGSHSVQLEGGWGSRRLLRV